MIEFLQNFHFLRPWVLLFLFIPLILYFKSLNTSVSSSWATICDKNLLKYLLVTNSGRKKISSKFFIYIGLIFATFAAAGPTWRKEEIPALSFENPVLFVLSLSQDMQLTDITPSRLHRAKYVISDIAEAIPQGQFGIEVYSQEPYLITPFTDDVELIKNLLPQIVPNIVPDGGDRLDRAINLATERFKSANFSSGNIIILASDVGQRFDLAMDGVKAAATANFVLNFIDTSPEGNEKLKLLAQAGKGIYMNVQEPTAEKLINNILNQNQNKIRQSENLRAVYIDFGYYLLLIPLICTLFFFRKGVLVLLLCLISTYAEASFFRNDNQDAYQLYQSGLYDQAAQNFKDSLWKGVSLYKAENYEAALEEFSKENSSNMLYNKGVVLTKLCQYEEALSSFEEAIKINPQNENAIYNKKVLEDLFEKAINDPKLLDCSDNQQQNNQNNSSQEDNPNPEQEQQNNTASNDSNSNQDDDKNKQDTQQEQDENNEQNQEQNKEQNKEQQNQNRSNEQNTNNENNNPENSEDSKQNNSASDQESNSSDVQQDKDNDTDSSNEKNGEQEKEQPITPVEAKQGDENDSYDEEALAMQRRYREIPEDVGGLLREFIKKEYLKDRYNDE